MLYTRWYDQDNYTRLLINTLEQFDDDIKIELANDLIQIIIQNKYPSDMDAFIEEYGSQYIPSKRRWYDRDETVHSAVEMVRYLVSYVGGDEKKDLLKEFFYSVVSSQGVGKFKILESKG